MTRIKRIRSLKGVGILANMAAKEPTHEFLRLNLVYGFNGSGKSTLSRMFASLQVGHAHAALPEDCSFEIELDDGTCLATPTKLAGLEERVCVFNTDFVNANLQWEQGTANSIFYLSQEQADLVGQLKAVEATLPEVAAAHDGAVKTATASAKTFSTYCTQRARTIHGARHLGTRKYEAPKLKTDYANVTYSKSAIVTATELAALEAVVTQSAPAPPIRAIDLDPGAMRRAIGEAVAISELSLGTVMLAELADHPSMVPWIKTGHEYHTVKGLDKCLLCQNELTKSRKEQLAIALDDRLSGFMGDVAKARAQAESLRASSAFNSQTVPRPTEFDPSLRARFTEVRTRFDASAEEVGAMLDQSIAALLERTSRPTQIVQHGLPSAADIDAAVGRLQSALAELNGVVSDHNAAVGNFAKRQEDADLAILKHFLAEGDGDYSSAKNAAEKDERTAIAAADKLQAAKQRISDLKAAVRVHGPAATKITKLVHAYLGHTELTIAAADTGYLLQRNGKAVKGQPSEGEKTAIALCYFLATLESEGRELKNLIVVIDDPVSSLDTRAMNYACALVRKRIEKAAQVFVLTHNQQCMNEFKKAWKNAAYPKSDATPQTARLLYMDVALSEGSTARTARLVEMSPLLREYDSEYHFLCQQVLAFEAAGTDHSPNLLLMPNAMRRVLEIFLAFKVPGSAPIGDKLQQLAGRHPSLDPVRLTALERLSQVESHSDNLDDLTGHSPMIIEEVRGTCATLLELMSVADELHTKAIRKQCGSA